MKSLKRFYDSIIYSEYGISIGIVTSLAIIVLLAFVAEVNFMWLFNSLGLVKTPYFLEFANIVLLVLIVNICQRAIKTTNRFRMLIYSAFFAVGVGLNFISFTNINWFHGSVVVDNLILISSLSRLVISIGLFLGVITNIDKKVKLPTKLIIYIVDYILIIGIVFVSLNLSTFFQNSSIGVLSAELYTTVEYITAIVLILSLSINFKNYSINKNKYVLMFTNGIVVLLMAQVVRLSFMNFTYISSLVYGLYSLIGYMFIYNAIFAFNILNPVQELINEEKQIKLYADNLEVIVDRRTTEMKNNNLRLIQEIEYAKNIQQSLLPPRRLNFKKVVFISEYFPCERLSGDFFDIYRLDDSNIGMYVLDVSGHGVSAALMTMFCNNYIRSSEKLIMKYRGLKPNRNLKHFYEEFNKMKFPDEMYMVMFFASYNVDTGLLTYSSGGINCHPMVMKRDGTKIFLDKSQGFPICKMSSFFTPTYTSETINLSSGDRVIFYTDGLVDNIKNVTITQDELESVMHDYRELSLKVLNNKIKSYINPEQGINEDDITYFIMEI